MSTILQKASSRKNKASDIGTIDTYKLDLEKLDVTFHTVLGGKEFIKASPNERVLIVIQGFANTIGDSKQVITDGAVISIKANETFEYQGQLKYYLVTLN